MYISLYASTFNTKFNIQTLKGTWIRRPTLFRVFTECNTLEQLVNVDFVSFSGFIYHLFYFYFFYIWFVIQSSFFLTFF